MVRQFQILEFSVVFTKEKSLNLKDYIEGINKDVLIKTACFFSRFGFDINNQELISNWFQHGNQSFAQTVYNKIRQIEQDREVRIINPYSTLRLFQLIIQECVDSDKNNPNLEVEIRLFKLYLLLNQEYTNKDKIVSKTTKTLKSECKFSALAFAGAFIDNDLVNYNLNKSISTQFQKAFLLFDELSKNKEFDELLKKFYEIYKVDDWKEYLKRILPLLVILLKAKPQYYIEIIIEKNDKDFLKKCEFIENLSISDDSEITEQLDFLELRSNPLYKFEEGKYLVINDLFLSERLFKTLYFKFNSINETLKNPIPELKSKYCDWFSEKRLLYDVLNYSFENKYLKFTGLELKSKGISAEPDYYIRNRNKVFLFESKDILIPASIKTSGDFNLLKRSFRSKLYFDRNRRHNKIDHKAILQLIGCIERLLDGVDFINVDNELRGKHLNIYPILVMHDNLYNTLGLNNLVNFWFRHELKKLEKKGKNIKKVRSVVLIDVDTMINIQESIRKSNCCYDRFIDGYIKDVININYKEVKAKEQAISIARNSQVSFSQYIENDYIISKNWSLPLHFRKFGEEILKENQYQ